MPGGCCAKKIMVLLCGSQCQVGRRRVHAETQCTACSVFLIYWSGSSVWLERLPVTQEVASSSLVRTAAEPSRWDGFTVCRSTTLEPSQWDGFTFRVSNTCTEPSQRDGFTVCGSTTLEPSQWDGFTVCGSTTLEPSQWDGFTVCGSTTLEPSQRDGFTVCGSTTLEPSQRDGFTVWPMQSPHQGLRWRLSRTRDCTRFHC